MLDLKVEKYIELQSLFHPGVALHSIVSMPAVPGINPEGLHTFYPREDERFESPSHHTEKNEKSIP
jgi:hypothetical protein